MNQVNASWQEKIQIDQESSDPLFLPELVQSPLDGNGAHAQILAELAFRGHPVSGREHAVAQPLLNPLRKRFLQLQEQWVARFLVDLDFLLPAGIYLVHFT